MPFVMFRIMLLFHMKGKHTRFVTYAFQNPPLRSSPRNLIYVTTSTWRAGAFRLFDPFARRRRSRCLIAPCRSAFCRRRGWAPEG
jgi:hypothetical protein